MSQHPTLVFSVIVVVALILVQTTPTTSTTNNPLTREQIFEFASRGIDLTTQNLFTISNQSINTEKLPIFSLSEDDEVENFVTDLITTQDHSYSTYTYRDAAELKELLNVKIASIRPGNFSYQLWRSSSYGRVVSESIELNNLYSATIATNLEPLLDEEFKMDLRRLPLRYNKETAQYYEMFFETYSNYCYTEIHFGTITRNQSKVTPEQVKNGNSSVVVPTGWKTIELYRVLEDNFPALHSEIVENLKQATETLKLKYEIRCYVEGLQVVLQHPYGKLMRGCYDPERLYKYFKDKLEEFAPLIDAEYERQTLCAAHAFDRIMELRELFQVAFP